jgi:hypothetical protein
VRNSTRFAATTLAAALVVAGLAAAEKAGDGERIRGLVVDTGGGPGRNTASLTIQIDRWSTDEEAGRLAGILRDKGLDALQHELEDLDYGWIRVGSSLGYPIAIARSIAHEDGTRTVRVVLDRPLTFLEVARSLRSEDYPLAIVEIRFDAEGEGEGTLAAAVKARFEGAKLIVETYGARPARVFQARVR